MGVGVSLRRRQGPRIEEYIPIDPIKIPIAAPSSLLPRGSAGASAGSDCPDSAGVGSAVELEVSSCCWASSSSSSSGGAEVTNGVVVLDVLVEDVAPTVVVEVVVNGETLVVADDPLWTVVVSETCWPLSSVEDCSRTGRPGKTSMMSSSRSPSLSSSSLSTSSCRVSSQLRSLRGILAPCVCDLHGRRAEPIMSSQR